MRRVLAFLAAELFQFEPVGAAGLFMSPIVAVAASSAFEPNIFSHDIEPK